MTRVQYIMNLDTIKLVVALLNLCAPIYPAILNIKNESNFCPEAKS